MIQKREVESRNTPNMNRNMKSSRIAVPCLPPVDMDSDSDLSDSDSECDHLSEVGYYASYTEDSSSSSDEDDFYYKTRQVLDNKRWLKTESYKSAWDRNVYLESDSTNERDQKRKGKVLSRSKKDRQKPQEKRLNSKRRSWTDSGVSLSITDSQRSSISDSLHQGEIRSRPSSDRQTKGHEQKSHAKPPVKRERQKTKNQSGEVKDQSYAYDRISNISIAKTNIQGHQQQYNFQGQISRNLPLKDFRTESIQSRGSSSSSYQSKNFPSRSKPIEIAGSCVGLPPFRNMNDIPSHSRGDSRSVSRKYIKAVPHHSSAIPSNNECIQDNLDNGIFRSASKNPYPRNCESNNSYPSNGEELRPCNNEDRRISLCSNSSERKEDVFENEGTYSPAEMRILSQVFEKAERSRDEQDSMNSLNSSNPKNSSIFRGEGISKFRNSFRKLKRRSGSVDSSSTCSRDDSNYGNDCQQNGNAAGSKNKNFLKRLFSIQKHSTGTKLKKNTEYHSSKLHSCHSPSKASNDLTQNGRSKSVDNLRSIFQRDNNKLTKGGKLWRTGSVTSLFSKLSRWNSNLSLSERRSKYDPGSPPVTPFRRSESMKSLSGFDIASGVINARKESAKDNSVENASPTDYALVPGGIGWRPSRKPSHSSDAALLQQVQLQETEYQENCCCSDDNWNCDCSYYQSVETICDCPFCEYETEDTMSCAMSDVNEIDSNEIECNNTNINRYIPLPTEGFLSPTEARTVLEKPAEKKRLGPDDYCFDTFV